MKKELIIDLLVAFLAGSAGCGCGVGFGVSAYAKAKAEEAIFDDENVAMIVVAVENNEAAKALDYTLDRESKTLWIKFDGNKLIKMKPKEIHPYFYQWVEAEQ